MKVSQKVEPVYNLELSEREAKVLAVVLSRFAGDRTAVPGWPSSIPLVEAIWPTDRYSASEFCDLREEISLHNITYTTRN